MMPDQASLFGKLVDGLPYRPALGEYDTAIELCEAGLALWDGHQETVCISIPGVDVAVEIIVHKGDIDEGNAAEPPTR
jgi:hypothetical protein